MYRIAILKANCDAIHKLGNIKRKMDDLIIIRDETETHFIGNFITGYGFIDVEYKKVDVRELTQEEKQKTLKMQVGINGRNVHPIANNEDEFYKEDTKKNNEFDWMN